MGWLETVERRFSAAWAANKKTFRRRDHFQ
jgi:hypothetical protein